MDLAWDYWELRNLCCIEADLRLRLPWLPSPVDLCLGLEFNLECKLRDLPIDFDKMDYTCVTLKVIVGTGRRTKFARVLGIVEDQLRTSLYSKSQERYLHQGKSSAESSIELRSWNVDRSALPASHREISSVEPQIRLSVRDQQLQRSSEKDKRKKGTDEGSEEELQKQEKAGGELAEAGMEAAAEAVEAAAAAAGRSRREAEEAAEAGGEETAAESAEAEAREAAEAVEAGESAAEAGGEAEAAESRAEAAAEAVKAVEAGGEVAAEVVKAAAEAAEKSSKAGGEEAAVSESAEAVEEAVESSRSRRAGGEEAATAAAAAGEAGGESRRSSRSSSRKRAL
ncbi:tol-Pal system protein TolA-like [Macrobrachium nipponense]|uniref:tol-Pal system protein TolA-like n=1 Tax=Macrobrachium nipponense TaxID=159736 RepID=UPI0030C89FB9